MTRTFNIRVRREARGASGKTALRSADSASRLNAAASARPLAPRASLLAPRPGISLLEVLISMFVLLFGLMGVAAIFPVGNHYAGKGDQYDRGAALAGGAFSEVKARGLLQPGAPVPGGYVSIWRYPDNNAVINTTTGFFQNGIEGGFAFVIDPVGAADTDPSDTGGNYYPYGAHGGYMPTGWTLRVQAGYEPSVQWPIRRVTMAPIPGGPKMGPRVAETIFRLRDDVVGELPAGGDQPGIQRWQTVDTEGTPKLAYDDTPLARAYAGNYSWLATVMPTGGDALAGLQPGHPRYGSFLYEVSVAVFYKRETTPTTESERAITAEFGPGGDLLLYSANDDPTEVDAAVADIRPSHWIAVAGVHPVTGKFLLKWYRLLALDDETVRLPLLSVQGQQRYARHAMVEGPDWPVAANSQVAPNLQTLLLPGVIGVSTQTLMLERE